LPPNDRSIEKGIGYKGEEEGVTDWKLAGLLDRGLLREEGSN